MSLPRTNRSMAQRAWRVCWHNGWVDRDQALAGQAVLHGRGPTSVRALAKCEDAFAGYAKQLGYKGATSRRRRNMGGIWAWLKQRLKNVDWVALAKLILPIILALIGL